MRKLSYKDKRELELLPAQIDALERKQAELVAQMGQPAFYQQSGTVINSTKAELERVEKEVALAYQRWNELEEK
ncbi:MAG: ABC transporter ATPase [Halothiobacillaceae bacterium]|nr:MAG: ABC transporter ATPase [Halothiobacillaceae bacterium]